MNNPEFSQMISKNPVVGYYFSILIDYRLYGKYAPVDKEANRSAKLVWSAAGFINTALN